MKFYVGIHKPEQACRVARAFISVNRVRTRRRPVASSDWILDSGAFCELATYGRYRHSPRDYAATVNRLAAVNPGLVAAVTQDFMCEPFMLARTGLDLVEHQRRTVERYDALRALVTGVYLMPVLQGYQLPEYLDCLKLYGDRLKVGAYVGVGTLCKRNADAAEIEGLLLGIKRARPDLRLHGFGIKTTSLARQVVRDCLESADSMAWSWAARWEGRKANHWREAQRFAERIETMPVQLGWRW